MGDRTWQWSLDHSKRLQKHGKPLHVSPHNLLSQLIVIDFTIGSVLSKPTLTCWAPIPMTIQSEDPKLHEELLLLFLPSHPCCWTISSLNEWWHCVPQGQHVIVVVVQFGWCWTQRLRSGLLAPLVKLHFVVAKELHALSNQHFWSSTAGSRTPDCKCETAGGPRQQLENPLSMF